MKRRTHPAGGSILEALCEAQKIAFAPFIFQACVAARRLGLLAAMGSASPQGADEAQLARETGLTSYAVGALVDALAAAGVCERSAQGLVRLTKTGECLAYDAMTGVNLDFTADVCYAGLARLQQSLVSGRPEGLRELTPQAHWETIYPALSSLPEPARTSWFAFDHYYSDRYFDALAARIAAVLKPRRLFDVGGNTGKFARAMLSAAPGVQVTIVDLPQQCRLARSNPELSEVRTRLQTASVNWLEPEAMPRLEDADSTGETPSGADVIWMSQFLECFPAETAVSILRRCRRMLAPSGSFAVLESLVDGQKWPASNLSLAASSLYFTAMANGNSRFYRRLDLLEIFKAAGLVVVHEETGLGVSHTLFVCKPQTAQPT